MTAGCFDCSTPLAKVLMAYRGAIMLYVNVGTPLQWSTLSPYIVQYYQFFNKSITLENASVMFPLMVTCLRISFWLK
jgi:hypothetical protein